MLGEVAERPIRRWNALSLTRSRPNRSAFICSAVTSFVRRKDAGYRIEIVYPRLDTPEIAPKRVATRVRQGGHHVPAADVRRRFVRSWRNFEDVYRPLCDAWWLYDATGFPPKFLARHP